MAIQFRSFVLSTLIATSVVAGSALPSWARPAILTSRNPLSAINLRSRPSTQALSPGAGIAGDRVEVLRGPERGDDGSLWYFVRHNALGINGWVRGDLLRATNGGLLGTNGGGGGNRPDGLGDAEHYYDIGYRAGQEDAIAARVYSPNYDNIPSRFTAVFRDGYRQGYDMAVGNNRPDNGLPAQPEEFAFNTENYAVRVFLVSGRPVMNVFHKPSTEMILSANPVRMLNEGGGYYYTNINSDREIIVYVPRDGGDRSLRIVSEIAEDYEEEE